MKCVGRPIVVDEKPRPRTLLVQRHLLLLTTLEFGRAPASGAGKTPQTNILVGIHKHDRVTVSIEVALKQQRGIQDDGLYGLILDAS